MSSSTRHDQRRIVVDEDSWEEIAAIAEDLRTTRAMVVRRLVGGYRRRQRWGTSRPTSVP